MKWETKSTSSFFSKSQCKLTKMSTGLACIGLFITFFFFLQDVLTGVEEMERDELG